jgi:hypothetical protein
LPPHDWSLWDGKKRAWVRRDSSTSSSSGGGSRGATTRRSASSLVTASSPASSTNTTGEVWPAMGGALETGRVRIWNIPPSLYLLLNYFVWNPMIFHFSPVLLLFHICNQNAQHKKKSKFIYIFMKGCMSSICLELARTQGQQWWTCFSRSAKG